MFARKRDAIEAHLTIVFTALAVAREAQDRTGLAIRNVSLCPWKIGKIVAAALVLLHVDHHRTT